MASYGTAPSQHRHSTDTARSQHSHSSKRQSACDKHGLLWQGAGEGAATYNLTETSITNKNKNISSVAVPRRGIGTAADPMS